VYLRTWLLDLAVAVITCKREEITSYEDAEELVVYDMDSRTIKFSLRKPRNIEVLEDVLEERGCDLWVFITASIPESVRDIIENMGVKVQIVRRAPLKEILEELFAP